MDFLHFAPPLSVARALPARLGALRRRLLFGYGPAWMRASVYGRTPPDALTRRLLESGEADEETR